jgi:hypothetical protein
MVESKICETHFRLRSLKHDAMKIVHIQHIEYCVDNIVRLTAI